MTTKDELRQQIREFEMPQSPTGSPVLWYRTGRKNCEPMVAYMLHCGGRTCQLFLTSGRRQDAVRHIDDPKLQLSVDQRESGAWDFTQESREYAEFRRQLEERLDRLEKAVENLQVDRVAKKNGRVSKKRKPGADNSQALREYRELQKQAQQLGLSKNMKKNELERAVANAQQDTELHDPAQL